MKTPCHFIYNKRSIKKMQMNPIGLQNIVKEKIRQFLEIAANISDKSPTEKSMLVKDALANYLSFAFDSNKQNREILRQAINRLSRLKQIRRTKGRLCGGLLMKGEKAYKCYQCMTEENSVLCQKCFELDKHVGHDFQRFQVYGGCCDCGDIQKWKETGFCSEHSKDQQIQIILDQNVLKDFLDQHIYAFELLLELYCKFLEYEENLMKQKWNNLYQEAGKKVKSEIILGITKIIDFYGAIFLDELVQFNKAGKYANAMTNHFFNSEITVRYYRNGEVEWIRNDVFSHLFTFLKLKDVPQKICDLCITLFPMVDFRQKVTLKYIDCYNNDCRFPTSTYTHLSSQLLTSHLMISKLISQGRIHALTYQPDCSKEEEVQKLAEGFLRYYYDMKYLSKLYGEASMKYFMLHAYEKKFVNLGGYRIILNKFLRAIDYYGLEQIFMDKMFSVLKVIQKDQSQQLSNMVLRQLYQFITTDQTQKYNKFRPQERLLTLIIFIRMRGDLNNLDNDDFMQNLFISLGVNNFKVQLNHLLKNFNSVLECAAQMLENNTLVQERYTFYSFYLKKSQKLFNSDALLLKILYKMNDFHNRLKHDQNRFDQMLLKHLQGPQQFMQSFSQRKLNQQDQDTQNAYKLVKKVKNYISFYLESLFSDLPQLSLMCALQPTQKELRQAKKLFKMPLEHLAEHYYQRLLESQQTNKVSIKSFKAVCELFFKEEQVFKRFAAKHKDPTDPMKLIKPKESNYKISELYFRSINSLPANKHGQVHLPPYCKWEKYIEVDSLVDMIEKTVNLIDLVNNQQFKRQRQRQLQSGFLDSIQQQMEEERAYSKKKSAFFDLSGQDSPTKKESKQYVIGDIPQLIVQLWKITLLTESNKASSLLKQLLKKDQIIKGLSALNPDLVSKIMSQANKKISLQNQKQKKQLQKKKLMEKKNLLKEKMNKNTELILQKETDNIEKMQEENDNQHICSICKDKRQNEDLCLMGFVAFTSGNLFDCSQNSQKIVPIFDSCGHAVHTSCLVSIINKNSLNKVYSICPLCKSPSNIQIPLKSHYDINDRKTLSLGLKKIYETLDYSFNEAQLDQTLCFSLALEVLFKGYLQPSVFQKNLSFYRIIYSIYQQSQLQDQLLNTNVHPAHQNPLSRAFALIFLKLTNQQSQTTSKYKNFGFSQHFVTKAQHILQRLKSPQFNEEFIVDFSEIEPLKNRIFFPPMQKNLASMNSKYRGKCHQCGLITNQQVICLSCPNFITCFACQKIKPRQHSREKHLGVNVFVKTDTGEVVYYMLNRFWKFPSLYEDYMGRAYNNASKQREQYELNEARLQQVKRDIYMCKVEQKVRYKENQTKQVYHQQIF